MRAVFMFLVGSLFLNSGPDRVLTMRVEPMVIMAGGSVRITCTVPRREQNRGITAALTPYRSMFDQLDGRESLVTHVFLFAHVPCEVETALCLLQAQGETDTVRTQRVLVGGCEP